MRIKCIAMREFPPFADGVISFPQTEENKLAEVQLITGQNGSGKTRLLCALAAACGNPNDLDSRHASEEARHRLVVAMSRDGKAAIYVRSSQQIMVLSDASDVGKLLDNVDALHPSH